MAQTMEQFSSYGQKGVKIKLDTRQLNKISKNALNTQDAFYERQKESPFERSQDDLKAYPEYKDQLPVIKYRKKSQVLTNASNIAPLDPTMDIKNCVIPRRLSITSRKLDNDIDLVRKRFRINNINHKNFDVGLRTKETERYWNGVYSRNNPEHVRETHEGANQPRNLY